MPILSTPTPQAPGTYLINSQAGNLVIDSDFGRAYLFIDATGGPIASPTLVTTSADFQATFPGFSLVDLHTFEAFLLGSNNAGLYVVRVADSTSTIVAPVAPASPASQLDWEWTARNVLDAKLHGPGFILAPAVGLGELFDQAGRVGIYQAFDEMLESNQFDGHLLLDFAAPTGANGLTILDPVDDVTGALAESLAYTAAGLGTYGMGSAYWNHPYSLKEVAGVEALYLIPWSGHIAGLALRRYSQQSYIQPPAGTLYQPRDVTRLSFPLNAAQHKALNDSSINVGMACVRNGISVMGARTYNKTNALFRWTNSSVIMAVVRNTFRFAYDDFIFEAIDGQGALLGRIRQRAQGILQRLWRNRALYGATPQEAYAVRIDNVNNPADRVQLGTLWLDVFVAVTPTLEQLHINLVQTDLGEVQLVYQAYAN